MTAAKYITARQVLSAKRHKPFSFFLLEIHHAAFQVPFFSFVTGLDESSTKIVFAQSVFDDYATCSRRRLVASMVDDVVEYRMVDSITMIR